MGQTLSVVFWKIIAWFWRRADSKPDLVDTQLASRSTVLVDASTQTDEGLNKLIIVEYYPRV